MVENLRFGIGIVAVLGLMVLVHEFGHFIVAKLFRVQVDIFSVGFGPRLFGIKRGGTDYRLSALPVGGYVKMAGDNPAEERLGAPSEFLSKARWQRTLIILAGPTMNLLTTLFLYTCLFTGVTPKPAYYDKPVELVGVPSGSPAEKAGLRAGDHIVEIEGIRNPTWEKAESAVETASPNTEISLSVERDGQVIPVTIPVSPMTQLCDQYGLIGYPPEPVIVEEVTPGSPAERSGMHSNDQIAAINGQPVASWCQFTTKVQESEGHPVQIDVRRGDQLIHLQVHPMAGRPGSGLKWQVGFSRRPFTTSTTVSWTEAASRSTWFTARLTGQMISLLGNLFRGRVSMREVMGPIGIMRESGRAAQRSVRDAASVMALVSLNLGILNLLPIPILDGGHILMLAIEGLIGRDLSLKIKERFVQVGLVFLLLIFAIAMYNDVLRMIPGH